MLLIASSIAAFEKTARCKITGQVDL